MRFFDFFFLFESVIKEILLMEKVLHRIYSSQVENMEGKSIKNSLYLYWLDTGYIV